MLVPGLTSYDVWYDITLALVLGGIAIAVAGAVGFAFNWLRHHGWSVR